MSVSRLLKIQIKVWGLYSTIPTLSAVLRFDPDPIWNYCSFFEPSCACRKLWIRNIYRENESIGTLFLKNSDKFNNKRGISARKFAVHMAKLGHEDEFTPIDGTCIMCSSTIWSRSDQNLYIANFSDPASCALPIIVKSGTLVQGLFTRLVACPKPVIGAVHAACVGGGVDLLTATDVRLCTRDAWFQAGFCIRRWFHV